MRTGLMSVFLYNRAIKLPLLPLLIHYFGLIYTLILFGYLILFSWPAGLLLELLPSPFSSNAFVSICLTRCALSSFKDSLIIGLMAFLAALVRFRRTVSLTRL